MRWHIAPETRSRILKILEAFLQDREEIPYALLFGSFVDPDFPGGHGDIDLAIGLDPVVRSRQKRLFAYEVRLQMGILRAFREQGIPPIPVEVVDLEAAPLSFRLSVLKGPYQVLKAGAGLSDLIERTGAQAAETHHLRETALQEILEDLREHV